MDYTRLMQKALVFIEGRLTCWISLEDIADVANFSMYHFHRMFLNVVGTTPKNYIRQRRLSQAGRELIFTLRPIAEIARRYQFESQAAFTRAFKKQFGITPGKLRRTRADFPYFEAIDLEERFKKGVRIMDVKIIEKEAMKVIGMKVVTTQKNNTIPQLWDKFNARWNEVENIAIKGVCVGICPHVDTSDFDENTQFAYISGMLVENFEKVPPGMETLDIPAQKYAVFTHKGALDTLNATYQYIYAEWLPNSEYELAAAAEIEWYDDRFKFGAADSEFDIYVPVK
ncbi:MAG: effector binding domain-containing protein [Candidatus Cloacimonetes bacterium]|nr:effector binding domain-containing protein [Candidatus Cloacimonadota bacterium]